MTRRLESPEEARSRLEAEPLAEHERAQLWRRIATSSAPDARRRAANARLMWMVGPALAVATALVLFVSSTAPPSQRAGGTAGQHPIADACSLDAATRELALPARCAARSVRVEDDDWLLAPGALVARTDSGAHVRAGHVRFAVRKRAAGEQFRVRVSHGEVRVIGTVFVVEQRDGRGSVTVSEGVIEFVWSDGQRERVAAGQSLRWPREPRIPAPTPAAATEVTTTARDAGTRTADAGSARVSPDLDRMLERLLQLQSQKRHAEAVALLKKTLAQPGLVVVQRERISYELGLALEANGQSSCAHWRKHVARFGDARRAAVLAERIARCEPRPKDR